MPTDQVTTHQDFTGNAHTDRCWGQALASLNDELMIQALPAAIGWHDEADAIEMWGGVNTGRTLAEWLSDGTATCLCDED